MSTISSSGTLTYSSGTFSYTGSFSSGDANTWPITVSASVTVTFGSDLTISTAEKYFIVGGTNVTIDGGNYLVTISSTGWLGLVKNGPSGYANSTIQRISLFLTSSSTSPDYGVGALTQTNFGGAGNCIITNCMYYNQSNISISQQFAGNSNNATITNCGVIVKGSLTGGSGSIVFASSGAISNCFAIIGGGITGDGGGISGNSNNGAISNCFTIIGGNLSFTSGGIGGQNTYGTVTNCYSIIGGNIADYGPTYSGGGIVGPGAGTSAITNCYAIVGGTINGAGIAGGSASRTITNCFVSYAAIGTGDIIASGGTQTNCSSANSGTWSSTGANWALNSYNSGAAWYNYDSNNLTPYVLSAFSTAVTSSQSVSTSPGTLALTSYGSGLTTGIVSSTTGGNWSFSNAGITYNNIIKDSYPLEIFAYDVLSNLTVFSGFAFTNAAAIETAYNADVANVNTIVPYMYSVTSDVTITSTVCFLEGSEILTMRGYVKIEELNKDDLIKTNLHGFKKIDKLGRSDMINVGVEERIKDQLYVCGKEEFKIEKDLIITGCHSILVDSFENEEQKEATRKLLGNIYVTCEKYRLPACLDSRCKVFEEKGKHRIYHITLENEDDLLSYGIYGNGLLVESCSKYTMDRDFDDRNVLIDVRK